MNTFKSRQSVPCSLRLSLQPSETYHNPQILTLQPTVQTQRVSIWDQANLTTLTPPGPNLNEYRRKDAGPQE